MLPPSDTPTRPLGKLEQESVDDALAGLGLKVDPTPETKTIGTIYVVNQEVFSRRDWWFQFFNIFHRTTRAGILQRELLFKTGQPYDQSLIEESVRNLQTPQQLTLATRTTFSPPELSSVVVIIPVQSSQPGMVDVLAVTRDVWSLRFNTNFEFQQGTLSRLDTSLSENNLFGWRKYLAMGLSLDLGKYAIGPTYFDPNIMGTRLQLMVTAVGYYARDSHDYEGNGETVSFRYPLYSLASRWGAGLELAHQDGVARGFQGTGLANVPLRGMSGVTVPYIYHRYYNIADASVTRSFGHAVIQRLAFGYRYDNRSYGLYDGFDYGTLTPVQLQAFLDQNAPATELRSEPFVRYEMFTATYAVYRNLETFDLRENFRLGPSVALRVAYGSPELGADRRAFPFSGTASWAIGPAGSYARLSLTAATRLFDGQAIDQTYQGTAYAASPMLWRTVRLVLSGEVDATRKDTQGLVFFLGGDTGMRGYVIGEFRGSNMYVAHAELRTAPVAIFSQRFGLVLFCDVGDAANTFTAMTFHSDVGTGLRWLIPQLNSTVLRIDWAVPLQNGPVTSAGFPGRISAGFQQVF